MTFLIADTFTDSLASLTGEEQKAVKTTAFDLQLNPANPGHQFHRLDKARDKRFWSVRVGSDIRLIVHRSEGSLLLCYVNHHDKAYQWAERRKLEIHPKTGAAQLVEIRETVKEVFVPAYVPQTRAIGGASIARERAPLFVGHADEELLGFGVPHEWLGDVRSATEESLLDIADHLPAEAAEALLEVATGGHPRVVQPVQAQANPFEHPDAQRRFRVMANVEELERALASPWDKWTIFLHPEQRHLVEGDFGGPARVSGSAGTGKTIVALHRAVHLARGNPDARVLLTTFSDTLARALHVRLRRLIGNQPRLGERIDVAWIQSVGQRLFNAHIGPVTLATTEQIATVIRDSAALVPDLRFTLHFLLSEWEQVVDAWQLAAWDDYRDVVRLGRKTRLREAQRRTLWEIFERVRSDLKEHGLMTAPEMLTRVAAVLSARTNPPYDFVVADEAQDLGVAHLRLLAALGGDRPNALFFAGDLGQRIFQQPFSWKALGVDIRGRSRTLRVNYRTSHQIRMDADRLLGPVTADVDGNTEDRSDTVSVFNGPPPVVRTFSDTDAERDAVGEWLRQRAADGVVPHECGVFVRTSMQVERALAAVIAAGLMPQTLDDHVSMASGRIAVGTMHLAKGLEFRAVAVMGCDDEVLPLQERIEAVGDDADLREVYDTERQLLYVACTRARDYLHVSGVDPASEFLDDLQQGTKAVEV